MGLYTYDSSDIPKSERITKLVEDLYAKMPEIESARAVLITESYRRTEGEPIIMRRAKAFAYFGKSSDRDPRSGTDRRKYNDRAAGLSDLSGILLRMAGRRV